MQEYIDQLKWPSAWKNRSFRKQFLVTVLILGIIAAIMPPLFNVIEKRERIILQDILLDFIPGYDLSFLYFLLFMGV